MLMSPLKKKKTKTNKTKNKKKNTKTQKTKTTQKKTPSPLKKSDVFDQVLLQFNLFALYRQSTGF